MELHASAIPVNANLALPRLRRGPLKRHGVARSLGVAGVLFLVFLAVTSLLFPSLEGFRAFIVSACLAGGGVVVMLGPAGYRAGYLLWIFSFVIGYRRIYITPHLGIHPSELLIWYLMVLSLLGGQSFGLPKVRFPWSKWVWLLSPFMISGLFTAMRRGVPTDIAVESLKNFILFVPVFHVTHRVIRGGVSYSLILFTYYVACVFIALLGSVEYFFPGVTSWFPAFMQSTTSSASLGGMARAGFTFWGASAASFVIVLIMPLIEFLWQRQSSVAGRILITTSAFIVLLGIYIAGYRSIWLILVAEISLYLFLTRGAKSVALVPIVIAALYLAASEGVKSRLETLLNPIRATDTSIQKRDSFARGAFRAGYGNPVLGLGWGGIGWPHSDFLQIAASLGMIAGVIFLLWYLRDLRSLLRACLSLPRLSPPRILASGLSASFVGAGGLLACQGVQVLPQLVLPVWLMWAVVECYLLQAKNARTRR